MQLLAAIQAGGQSRRMGSDKAWLELDGQPMIERVLHAARPVAQRLSIVISQTTREPERYAALANKWNAALLVDLHDLRGPLGGIETALLACQPNEHALILACDLPFLTPEFLQLLCDRHKSDQAALTIPLDAQERPNMLCGIYGNECLLHVQQMLADNLLRVNILCNNVLTTRLSFSEYSHFLHAERLLTNINSPDQLNKTDLR